MLDPLPEQPDAAAMLPAETADVEERASKAPRIRTVTFGDRNYDLNDEGYDADVAEWEDSVSFFEYLEKIELYYSKKNNSENVFRELKNSKVLF